MTNPHSPKFLITTETSEKQQRAQYLAKQLDLPYREISECDSEWLLVFTAEHLELRQSNNKIGGPIYVDFLHGKTAYRQYHGGGKQQLIAKAVGIKSNIKPTILDVTAGFAQDAYVLASLGCKIQMIERSPIIAALLEDALLRAEHNNEFRKNCHLTLLRSDSITYLQQLILNKVNTPDVIYLDPMYPSRTKSALVKKELRALREIVGEDHDATELLNLALQIAKKRVVIKRPKSAPTLNDSKPSIIYQSVNTRFDVYLI
jgi:16S rRNA (guanine1516-N2)-methyltransferase